MNSMLAPDLATPLLEVYPKALFLNQGTFCALLGETLGNVWRQFWFSKLGSRHWHLVGRGQRWCRKSYNALDSLPQSYVILHIIMLLLRNSVGQVCRNIDTHLSVVHSSEKLEITKHQSADIS